MTGTVVMGQLTQGRQQQQQQRRIRNYLHVFPLLDIWLRLPMQNHAMND